MDLIDDVPAIRRLRVTYDGVTVLIWLVDDIVIATSSHHVIMSHPHATMHRLVTIMIDVASNYAHESVV